MNYGVIILLTGVGATLLAIELRVAAQLKRRRRDEDGANESATDHRGGRAASSALTGRVRDSSSRR
jgi:hypothetical protein